MIKLLKTNSKTFQIDSMKVRIPINEVEILNKEEFERFLKVDQYTGETERLSKGVISLRENGIPLKLQIGEKEQYFGKTKDKYLWITLNSKQLGRQYFQRITNETLPIIYDYIISKKLVYFTYESLLNSFAVDVDFCKDKEFDYKQDSIRNFSDYTSRILSYTKESHKAIKLRFNKDNNKGFQWSKRAITDYISKPFIKVYSKTLDFEEHSKEFYDNFIKGIYELPKELIRIEFTIKALKHLKTFGIESNQLFELLNLENDIKDKMLINHINKHIIKEELIKMNKSEYAKLNINDKGMINLMEAYMQINNSNTIEEVIEFISDGVTNRKQTLTSYKKKLLKLYNEHLKEHFITRDKSTSELSNLVKFLTD